MQTTDADQFAANTLPIIDAIRASGVADLRGLALALNSRGVRTARGGRWHVSNVKNLMTGAPFCRREGPYSCPPRAAFLGLVEVQDGFP